MDRMIDWLADLVDTWQLGFGALLLAAISVISASMLIGIPTVLLAALADFAFGPLGPFWSDDTVMLLVGLASVPIGVGVSVPFAAGMAADIKDRAKERRKRAVDRMIAKHRRP